MHSREPMPPELTHDFLIVGHGLAGATLAWELIRRGHRPLVIDREEVVTSSLIAAGIVTPITGQRVALGWRIAEFWPCAANFHEATAAMLGRNFFHMLPHVRLLNTPDEERRWAEKRNDPAFAQWLVSPQPEPLVPPGAVAGPGFAMQSAWLDVRGWIMTSRQWLKDRGLFLAADAGPVSTDSASQAAMATSAGTIHARTIVFCQGHEASRHPHFSWLRWKSAKGEILDLSIPDLPDDRILNRSQWLLPLGDGRFRSGSGYAWDDLTTTPTEAGCRAIEAQLGRMITVPWQVTGQSAAVRPILRESRAIIGRHPAHPQLAFFNGLGSKGVLHAPWFAAQLADFLTTGRPPEYEADLCRNA